MSNRLHEIDGIRGWAALVVLLFHLTTEMFGALIPAFKTPLAHLILNGGLAVSVFFVLSGDALSAGFLKSRNPRTLEALVVKRYFRLTVPIFLSCALAYLLMVSGLTYNLPAAEIVRREAWLGGSINFAPSLISLLRYSFYQVYDGHSQAISYNPFLWTMSIELIGSLLVALYLYISGKLRNPAGVLYGLVGLLFAMRSFYALFFFGVLLGHYRVNGTLDQFRSCARWKIALPFVLIASIGAIYTGRRLPMIEGHLNIMVAAILVFSAYTSKSAIAFFSSRLSRFLGEISFPLYLVHFSVIVSFTSFWIIQSARTSALDSSRIMLIVAASTVVSILAAMAFRRLEIRSLKWVDSLPARLLLIQSAPTITKSQPAGLRQQGSRF